MQTILGSGGAIGTELAKALCKYTKEIRLVSRNPQKINPGDQLMSADLTDPEDVSRAVEGSQIVYLTVGLPYKTEVWQSTWPLLMKNVIAACQEHKAKLVFFDNIYMYNPNELNWMNEETTIAPVSNKGGVRSRIAFLIMDEVKRGNLEALIARSADFYGPGIKGNSVLTETVFKKLYLGKKAQWLCSDKFKHSFTYTPDAGIATALLGNTPDAFNQVWHLPTATNPLTGEQWIKEIAREMGAEPRYMVVSKFMVKMLGILVPVMKEMVEMLYQYDRDYVFDSMKFEKRFNITATPYTEGIRKIVGSDYSKSTKS